MTPRLLSATVRTMALFAFVLTGCASFGKKFKETKTVNFAPFAEQTLILLASLDYELSPNEVFLIAPYVSPNEPSLLLLQSRVRLEREFLKGVMSYSIAIVNLSESTLPPKAQVKEYVVYVSSLVASVRSQELADVLMPEEKIRATLKDIGSKEKLLDAMQAARPFIIEFNKVNLRLIRDIGSSRTTLAGIIHRNIDAGFHPYVDSALSLRAEKGDVVQGLGLLRAAALGDRTAKQKLGAIPGLLPPPMKATDPGVEKYLANRLTILTQRQEQVRADIDVYRELKLKLDLIKTQHDEMIRAGGRAVLMWTQAHQKMASGLTNPAEWFGWSDAKSMLTGAAKKVTP